MAKYSNVPFVCLKSQHRLIENKEKDKQHKMVNQNNIQPQDNNK